MLTRLENILTFQRYEKWKVEEKLGSKAHPCYIRIRVITNRVISRFKCITRDEAVIHISKDADEGSTAKNLKN